MFSNVWSRVFYIENYQKNQIEKFAYSAIDLPHSTPL